MVIKQIPDDDKLIFSKDGKVLYKCKFTDFVEAIKWLMKKVKNES